MVISYPDYLFIYKEKKGELDIFSNNKINDLNNIDNLFIVRSKKPRFLKYDQFEDLIKISDCIISMSHTSTTIWQAISEMKYVIAINNCFDKSFLADFDIETNLNSLKLYFEKWLNMSNKDVSNKLEMIKNKVNITDYDGLNDVYEDLKKKSQIVI